MSDRINAVHIFAIGCFLFALLQNLSNSPQGAFVAYLCGLLLLIIGSVLVRRFHLGKELSARATIIGLIAPYFFGGLKVFFGGFLFAVTVWIGRSLWQSTAQTAAQEGGNDDKDKKLHKLNPFHLAGFLLMTVFFLFIAAVEALRLRSLPSFESATEYWPVCGTLVSILVIAGLIYRHYHPDSKSLNWLAAGLMLFWANLYLVQSFYSFP